MRHRRGLTLAEAVVTLAIVVVIALVAVWLMWRAVAAREEGRRIRCRWNLNHLAKGMATYLNEHGGNRFYPFPVGRGTRPDTFNGAEWLAGLYWTGVVPDSALFVCPSTADANANGADIGTFHAGPAFSSGTVSYAAMHHRCGMTATPSATGYRQWDVRVATDHSGCPTPGAIRDDYLPNLPIASDDTQGAINHRWPRPRGMSVVFLDSHVEFWVEPDIDPANAVGLKPGPLWLLSN